VGGEIFVAVAAAAAVHKPVLPDSQWQAIGLTMKSPFLSRTCFPPSRRVNLRFLKHLKPVMNELVRVDKRKAQALKAARELWLELMQLTFGNVVQSIAYIVSKYRPSTAHTYLKRIASLFPELRTMESFQRAMHRIRVEANVALKDCAAPASPVIVKLLIGQLTHPCQILVFQMWSSASRFADLQQMDADWFGNFQAVRLRFSVPHKSDPSGSRRVAKWIPCGSLAEATRLWKRQPCSYEKMYEWLQTSACPLMTCHSFRHGAIRLLLRHHYEAEISTLSGHAIFNQPKGILPYCCPAPTSARAKVCMTLSKKLMDSLRERDLSMVPTATRICAKEVTFTQP
jgi:hypothetical protein